MKGYRFLEHTADIKIEAWGDSLEEAFEAAGMAFTDTFIERDKVEKLIYKKISVEGFDLMSLLFNWIEELILIFELENIVFSDFKVKIKRTSENEYKLDAMGWGEQYSREKHGYKVHVKAMTYHEMEIKNENNRYVIRYVVDI